MSAHSQNASDETASFGPADSPEESLHSQSEHEGQGNLSMVGDESPAILDRALVRTMGVIEEYNLASAEDCTTVSASVRQKWGEGRGADPIDCLARLRAGDGQMLDASVDAISTRLAQALPLPPTRVPFASRLIAPTNLYEKNPDIELLCRLMQVPILYAEDLDVLALGSINPYFVDALSVVLTDYVKDKTGIQPLISHIRLDYIGWAKMCQKHFREGPEI